MASARSKADPRATQQGAQGWRNRIIGEGEEAPDQLLANPANWRIHPKQQQDALAGVLNEVGWVQRVIVNQRTGHLVDGHLRVALALRQDAPTVPVLYVDLDEAEERLILASLDPLAAMAAPDKEKLRDLLDGVQTGEAAVQAMLAQLAGISVDVGEAASEQVNSNFQVLIVCRDEAEQVALLERFSVEGLSCKALVS